MKIQLVIIGIVAILVGVGLSGCDDDSNNTKFGNETLNLWQEPNFEIIFQESSDNFATISGNYGTVWVDISIKNSGGNGSKDVWVRVYQGTGNFTSCGNYSQSVFRTLYLRTGEATHLIFSFFGVDCRNNSGCYGVSYWIE